MAQILSTLYRFGGHMSKENIRFPIEASSVSLNRKLTALRKRCPNQTMYVAVITDTSAIVANA